MTTIEKVNKIISYIEFNTKNNSWSIKGICKAKLKYEAYDSIILLEVGFWDGVSYSDTVTINVTRKRESNEFTLAIGNVIDTLFVHLPEEAKETDKEKIIRLEKKVEELTRSANNISIIPSILPTCTHSFTGHCSICCPSCKSGADYCSNCRNHYYHYNGLHVCFGGLCSPPYSPTCTF